MNSKNTFKKLLLLLLLAMLADNKVSAMSQGQQKKQAKKKFVCPLVGCNYSTNKRYHFNVHKTGQKHQQRELTQNPPMTETIEASSAQETQKPFECRCNDCTSRYHATKDALHEHMKEHWEVSSDRLYHCTWEGCEHGDAPYYSKDRRNFKKHMERHIQSTYKQVGDFTCHACKFTTDREDLLRTHKKTKKHKRLSPAAAQEVSSASSSSPTQDASQDVEQEHFDVITPGKIRFEPVIVETNPAHQYFCEQCRIFFSRDFDFSMHLRDAHADDEAPWGW